MTDKQYASAELELLGRLQTMRENESGARLVIPKKSSSGAAGATSTPWMMNMTSPYRQNTKQL
jgi:hypothetical protein